MLFFTLGCLGAECFVAPTLDTGISFFLKDTTEDQGSKDDTSSEEKEGYKVKSQVVDISIVLSALARVHYFYQTKQCKEIYHSLPEIPPETV